MALRPRLRGVVTTLLGASEESGEATLDAIGDAIGTERVTTDEVEQIFAALEDAGRRIVGPSGGGGETRLRAVLAAARALQVELGRRATLAEIAERARLTPTEVRYALALARTIKG